MKPLTTLAAFAVIGSLALPAVAQAAAKETYTFRGTVQGVSDPTGAFASTTVPGGAFTAVLVRDDATPGAITYAGGNAISNACTGSITFGGQTFDLTGNLFSHQYQGDYFGIEAFTFNILDRIEYTDTVIDYQTTWELSFSAQANSGTDYLAGDDYHTLPSMTAAATPGFNWGGYFSRNTYDTFANVGILYSQQSSQVNFTVESLTVGAAAVPEPATWAMMLVGFGALGATLRRRRGAVLAA